MTTTIIVAALSAVALAAAGGLLTPIDGWYRALRKPPWQPPDWLFGPAWTVILGLAAWSGVLAWEAADGAAEQRVVAILFGVNALFHLLWSPLFFKLRRPDWALIEVIFLWASLLALCLRLPAISPLAAWLIVPYIAWVSFAALLNREIVRQNAPFGRGVVLAQ